MPTRRAVLAAVAAAAGLGSAEGLDGARAPAEGRPEGADELAAFVQANRDRLDEMGLGPGSLPDRRDST